MTNNYNAVCVYCSSSNRVKQEYKDLAKETGGVLAKAGITVVYGGARMGLMGVTADAALEQGGKVIGVITRYLLDREVEHHGLTESHVVETMHERKAMMVDNSDAFIALPGSLGTLEELIEIATWRQIGLTKKPIILVNPDGFWDPLLAQIDRMIEEKCMLTEHRGIFQVISSPDEILNALECFNPESFNVESKWSDQE